MNRRAFVTSLGAVLATPRAAEAQQRDPYRVLNEAARDGMRKGLAPQRLIP
jgi:muramidase (phage lysozyme)